MENYLVVKYFVKWIWTLTSSVSCGGGELLETLTTQTFTTETEIAGYIRQILWGLEYLHSQDIAHLGLTVSFKQFIIWCLQLYDFYISISSSYAYLGHKIQI